MSLHGAPACVERQTPCTGARHQLNSAFLNPCSARLKERVASAFAHASNDDRTAEKSRKYFTSPGVRPRTPAAAIHPRLRDVGLPVARRASVKFSGCCPIIRKVLLPSLHVRGVPRPQNPHAHTRASLRTRHERSCPQKQLLVLARDYRIVRLFGALPPTHTSEREVLACGVAPSTPLVFALLLLLLLLLALPLPLAVSVARYERGHRQARAKAL